MPRMAPQARRRPIHAYDALRGRLGGRGEGTLWEAIEEAEPASDGDGVWGLLATETDPALLRPRLAPDAEIKEFHYRSGGGHAVVANPRDLIHYRLDFEQLELVRLMDGTRTVKEIVVERFRDSGDLELSGVSDLVQTLREGGMLDRLFLDTHEALARAIDPVSLPRRKIREFFSTLTIEWKGAHRMVQWLHDHVTKWIFHRWVRPFAALFAVLGVVAFVAIVRGGRFTLTGRSLGVGVLVLLALDYFMVFVHELGHASVLVHHGRRVKSAGFQIYFGSPAFFVDSSDGLMMERKHQLWESFAGPYAQLLIGAAATTIAWAFPDWFLSETLYRFSVINYLVLTMNLIPLLELDGYWILSDLLESPDLRPSSLRFLRYDLWHKLRTREALSRQEVGLLLYGILGVVFTVFSFYTAYFYWRTIFGDLVGNLWDGGALTRGLLVVFALFLLGPVLRGAIKLVRALIERTRSIWRGIRFRLEQSWRVEAAQLIDALPVFDNLPVEILNDLAGRVRLRQVDAGAAVVRQGERADAFYVVRSGTFQVLEEEAGTERTLRTLGSGESFGELGLVEAAPRRATVRAVERSEVIVVDKGTFDRLLADEIRVPEFAPTAQAVAEVRALRPFSHLEPDDAAELLEHGGWENLAPGTEVVVQGEPGDAFYVVGAGRLQALKDGELVAELGPGGFFGELALLLDAPRAATVRALTPVRLFRVDREGFDRLVAKAFRRGTLDRSVATGREQHH